jgi:hypothetical protein
MTTAAATVRPTATQIAHIRPRPVLPPLPVEGSALPAPTADPGVGEGAAVVATVALGATAVLVVAGVPVAVGDTVAAAVDVCVGVLAGVFVLVAAAVVEVAVGVDAASTVITPDMPSPPAAPWMTQK